MMYMTIVPQYKICPRCKRRYSWNPDIGQMWCPFCGPKSTAGAGDILWVKKVFEKLNEHKNEKNGKQNMYEKRIFENIDI